jgi:hypothetical protein
MRSYLYGMLLTFAHRKSYNSIVGVQTVVFRRSDAHVFMTLCIIVASVVGLAGCVSKPWNLGIVITNKSATMIVVKSSHTGEEIDIGPSHSRELAHGVGVVTISTRGKPVAYYTELSALGAPKSHISTRKRLWANYSNIHAIWGPDEALYLVRPGMSDYDGPGAIRVPKVEKLDENTWEWLSEEDRKALPEHMRRR